MSTMSSFTLRTLKKNKVRTLVSIAGIVLSCALITAVFTSVASIQDGLLDRTLKTEGSWHAFNSQVSDDDIERFAENDHIPNIATSRDLGAALFTRKDAEQIGSMITVRTLPEQVKGSWETDGVSLSTLPELKQGRLPETAEEILLPDIAFGIELDSNSLTAHQTAANTQSTSITANGPLNVGSKVTINLGVRRLNETNEVLNSTSFPLLEDENEIPLEHFTDVQKHTYTVVGFYEVKGAFEGNDIEAGTTSFVAFTSKDAYQSEDGSRPMPLAFWANTTGLSTAAEISNLFYELTPNFSSPESPADFDAGTNAGGYIFHNNLYRYQGISDDRPVWDTLMTFAIILATVIVVASVSLIYNSFAISVAERTRQFGLLSSIGASRKQIRRSVLFEALVLGAIGIPLGILLGYAGCSVVFNLTGDAFASLLSSDAGLRVVVSPWALGTTVALSLITLLISAWIPALRASHVSAVDAIRQTQDIKLNRRARKQQEKLLRKAAQSALVSPTDIEQNSVRAQKNGFSEAVRSAFKRGGIWGKLFGTSGVLAKRNLSRSSARGRTVVLSLAISVTLIITSGAIALYFQPLSDLANNKDYAGLEGDVTATINNPTGSNLQLHNRAVESFENDIDHLEDAELAASYKQGVIQAYLPAEMISNTGREVQNHYNQEYSEPWVPSRFGADGSYAGQCQVYYLDQETWDEIIVELGLDHQKYNNPEKPVAIGLNALQGTLDGEYVNTKPYAQPGVIDYYVLDETPESIVGEAEDVSWAQLGLLHSDKGLVAGYINSNTAYNSDETDSSPIEEFPLNEVSGGVKHLEIGALYDQLPACLSSTGVGMEFPAILLPDSVTKIVSQEVQQHAEKADNTDVFLDDLGTYWFACYNFVTEDHTKTTQDILDLKLEDSEAGTNNQKEYVNLSISAFDHAESAEEGRSLNQAIRIFLFSFSIITILIAVANVFNTLANSIILRTREFAMLKSVGMGDKAFARMLFCECGSYALRGLSLGLALGLLVVWGLYWGANYTFYGLNLQIPWESVGIAVAMVLVVLALSVLYALRRSHAANIVEALRTDAI